MALVLFRALPVRRPPTSVRYHRLLAGVGRLIREEPALRRRMVYGACGFAVCAAGAVPAVIALAAWGMERRAAGKTGPRPAVLD